MTRREKPFAVRCYCEICGYIARVSQCWLRDVGAPLCPLHGPMRVDLPPPNPPKLIPVDPPTSLHEAFRRQFGCMPSTRRPCRRCAKPCTWPDLRDALTLDAIPAALHPYIRAMAGVDAFGALAEAPNYATLKMATNLGCSSPAVVLNLAQSIGLSRRWQREFRRRHDSLSPLLLPPTARRYLRIVAGLDDEGHLVNDPVSTVAASRQCGRSKNAVGNVLTYWNLDQKTVKTILRHQFMPDAIADDDDAGLLARFYGDSHK